MHNTLLRKTKLLDSTQQAQTIIAAVPHPHAPGSHGYHAERVIELPERRALAAPGPRALQLTGDTLPP